MPHPPVAAALLLCIFAITCTPSMAEDRSQSSSNGFSSVYWDGGFFSEDFATNGTRLGAIYHVGKLPVWRAPPESNKRKDEADLTVLVRLIKATVDPESWDDHNLQANAEDSTLYVWQTVANHRKISELFDRLAYPVWAEQEPTAQTGFDPGYSPKGEGEDGSSKLKRVQPEEEAETLAGPPRTETAQSSRTVPHKPEARAKAPSPRLETRIRIVEQQLEVLRDEIRQIKESLE